MSAARVRGRLKHTTTAKGRRTLTSSERLFTHSLLRCRRRRHVSSILVTQPEHEDARHKRCLLTLKYRNPNITHDKVVVRLRAKEAVCHAIEHLHGSHAFSESGEMNVWPIKLFLWLIHMKEITESCSSSTTCCGPFLPLKSCWSL